MTTFIFLRHCPLTFKRCIKKKMTEVSILSPPWSRFDKDVKLTSFGRIFPQWV